MEFGYFDMQRAPLHFACESDAIDAERILIENGARIDIKDKIKQNFSLSKTHDSICTLYFQGV